MSSIKEEPINCKIDALGNKELEKYSLTADPQKQIHKNISRATDVARLVEYLPRHSSPGFDPSTVAMVTHLKIPIF